MMRGNRLGISPVMATVILVAIAIVIAIAVAFWATGLVGVFTRFEKLEITSAYAIPASGGTYDITIIAKNTGSSPATIDNIHINGVPICGVTSATIPGLSDTPTCPTDVENGIPLLPGQNATITISNVTPNSPGVTVEVALHTASGKIYPYSVLLP